jgi:hypothetical protein
MADLVQLANANSWITDRARGKAVYLADALQSALIQRRALDESVREAKDEQNNAKFELDRLYAQRNRYDQGQTKALAEAEALVQRLGLPIARRQKPLDEMSAVVEQLAPVVNSLARFLQQNRNQELKAQPVLPQARPNKGETFMDALARLRAEIATIAEQEQAVRNAPYPSVEVIERGLAEIAAFANLGEPDVLSAIEEGGPIKWVNPDLVPRYFFVGQGGMAPVDAQQFGTAFLAFSAWRDRPQLEERFKATVLARADDANAIPAADRMNRIGALLADRLGLERAEESLVDLAADQGVEIYRRVDVIPEVVLGLDADARAVYRRKP